MVDDTASTTCHKMMLCSTNKCPGFNSNRLTLGFIVMRWMTWLRVLSRGTTRGNDPPALHCDLDQFHVGRIQIPEAVARKQLDSKLQNERNDKVGRCSLTLSNPR